MIYWRVSSSDLVLNRSGGQESRKESAGLYVIRSLSLLHPVLTFNGQPTKEAAQTSCDMVHTNMPCGLMGRSTTEKLPQRKRLPCFITGSQSLRYRTQRNDKPAQSCGIRLLRRTQKDLVPRVPRIDAYNIVISTPTGRQDGLARSSVSTSTRVFLYCYIRKTGQGFNF